MATGSKAGKSSAFEEQLAIATVDSLCIISAAVPELQDGVVHPRKLARREMVKPSFPKPQLRVGEEAGTSTNHVGFGVLSPRACFQSFVR